MFYRAYLLVAIPVFALSPLAGQETELIEVEPKALCSKGHRLPVCRSFWITEVGLVRKIANHSLYTDYYFTWDIGAMVNRSDRDAFGGTLYAGALLGESFRWGLRGRYRRWLTPNATLDIAPGILLGVSNSDKLGFSSQVGVGYSDWISFYAQLDITHRWQGDRRTHDWVADWFAGVRVGSKPAQYAAAVEAMSFLGLTVLSLWLWYEQPDL